MLWSHFIGLVFTGSYYSNSMLPHCLALLSFLQCYSLLLLRFGQVHDNDDDDDDDDDEMISLFDLRQQLYFRFLFNRPTFC